MRFTWRNAPLRLVAPAALAAGALMALAAPANTGAEPSVNQLSKALKRQEVRQTSLAANIAGLSQSISSLGWQISLVQSRETALATDLSRDRGTLTLVGSSLASEQHRVDALNSRLTHARMVLAQLVLSRYESQQPDLVGVVIEAHGFSDLLEHVDFLRRVEQRQQAAINTTKTLRAQVQSSTRRLRSLENANLQLAAAATTRGSALAGMNTLLQDKQAALSQARSVQQAALARSRVKGHELQAEIGRLHVEQTTAEEAAATPAPATQPAPTTASHPQSASPQATLGNWSIPYVVVLCESGAQNLPPNGAGASGYYQIVPSTWKQYGGHGPAAYLASKTQQDAIAKRIWAGGAGASNWACAGIVGIR